MTTDSVSSFDLLTEPQRQCLRLVYQHMTSKDIARVLGISHYTVDMRLARAMRTLGVNSRIEAARLFAAFEAASGTSETFVYEALGLPNDDKSRLITPSTGQGPSDLVFDEQGASGPIMGMREAPLVFEYDHWPRLWRGGRRNDLSIFARIGWIMAIAIGSAIAVGAILSSLEALKNLL